MFRILVLSCVSIFASHLFAIEPNDGVEKEIAKIKRQLAELSRRVNAIEGSIVKPSEDAMTIRFDRLRVPYDDDDDAISRRRAHAKIAGKARETFLGGTFSNDIGWEEIAVANVSEIETVVLQFTVSRIPIGQMSEIIDDGSAFSILHVTNRSR